MTDWQSCVEALAAAGRDVEERATGDAVAAGEGYRFINRLYASMRLFLLEQDPENPDFVPVMTPHRKFFADNPDTLYHRAPIREDLVYRISGTRGTCAYLSFCVYAVGPKGTRIVSDLPDDRLECDSEGRFEIVLSLQAPPDGCRNWLRFEPGVRSLVTRQYYLDRSQETPATYEISCENAKDSSELSDLTPRIGLLRDSFQRAWQATLKATDAWRQTPNVISFESGASGLLDLFPTPDNQYAGGWFQLGDDEALVVEVDPPDCRYWSVHLMSPWLESLEGQASVNKRQVQLEAGQPARFIIAARDPGQPNWLATGGRREGCFAFRWMQTDAAVSRPVCQVISLS